MWQKSDDSIFAYLASVVLYKKVYINLYMNATLDSHLEIKIISI